MMEYYEFVTWRQDSAVLYSDLDTLTYICTVWCTCHVCMRALLCWCFYFLHFFGRDEQRTTVELNGSPLQIDI